MDADELHQIMQNNKNFGSFGRYRCTDDMRIVTTASSHYDDVGPYGAVYNVNRFYKVDKKDDGSLEAYEVDDSGKKIGNSFLLK